MKSTSSWVLVSNVGLCPVRQKLIKQIDFQSACIFFLKNILNNSEICDARNNICIYLFYVYIHYMSINIKSTNRILEIQKHHLLWCFSVIKESTQRSSRKYFAKTVVKRPMTRPITRSIINKFTDLESCIFQSYCRKT